MFFLVCLMVCYVFGFLEIVIGGLSGLSGAQKGFRRAFVGLSGPSGLQHRAFIPSFWPKNKRKKNRKDLLGKGKNEELPRKTPQKSLLVKGNKNKSG